MDENEERNVRTQKEKYVGELPQKGITGITGKKVAPAGICTYLHTITMTKVMKIMMMMMKMK